MERKETMEKENKLLSVCELADALGRSVRYVVYMKARGFTMRGGRATLSEALRFLEEIQTPCARTEKKKNC